MTVALLQIPPFDRRRPIGGGEVVAIEVVAALAAEQQVDVVCGYGTGAAPPAPSGDRVRVVPGFPITDAVRRDGHVRPELSARAAQVLESADVVISVERSLDLDLRGPRLVLLGGVGAPHTLDVLRHGGWDLLVVPSGQARGLALEAAPAARKVVVVPNGVDTELFAPGPPGAGHDLSELRMLVSARPIAGKGLDAAVQVTARIRARRGTTTLLLTDLQDSLDRGSLLMHLQRQRATVTVLNWRERDQMPDLYRAADATLCLSQVPEGFGLVAAESLSCGTPVLATGAGHLAHLVPPSHGMAWIDTKGGVAAWDEAIDYVLEEGRADARTRGRGWIEEHYGLTRMHESIRSLVRKLRDQ